MGPGLTGFKDVQTINWGRENRPNLRLLRGRIWCPFEGRSGDISGTNFGCEWSIWLPKWSYQVPFFSSYFRSSQKFRPQNFGIFWQYVKANKAYTILRFMTCHLGGLQTYWNHGWFWGFLASKQKRQSSHCRRFKRICHIHPNGRDYLKAVGGVREAQTSVTSKFSEEKMDFKCLGETWRNSGRRYLKLKVPRILAKSWRSRNHLWYWYINLDWGMVFRYVKLGKS